MSRWFLYFLFYSLLGCGLEKLFARAAHSPRQTRKCFLILPLCPVYGLAMCAVLALIPEGTGFWVLAAAGGIVCTAVEYLVHLFYDKVFGVWFWDYRDLQCNLGGRICPQFALIWGALSAIAVQFVQPLAAELAAAAPPAAVFALWMLLWADCVLTGALLLHRRDVELLTVKAVVAQIRLSSQSSTS